MIFEEFNPNIHDHHKVAELMYSVDFRTYLEVFKTKENAIIAFEDLLLIEEEHKNSKLTNFKMYVIMENTDFEEVNTDFEEVNYINVENYSIDNSINNIIGILEIVEGKKASLFSDMLYLFRKMKLSYALKFAYIFFLDSLVLSNFNEDDLYLAEVAIDEPQRGKGLGTKIIKKVIEKAKKKGFKRVVLDSDLRNTGATKLYESIGFKKIDEKSPKFFKKERGMNNMEYIL